MTTIRQALTPPDRTTGVVLLSSVVLPVAYVYNGGHRFFSDVLAAPLGLAGDPMLELYARLYQFGAIFVLFGVIPFLIAGIALKRAPSTLGIAIGDWRAGLKIAGIALVVAAPAMWINGGMPDFQAEYPLSKLAAADPTRFMLYEASYLLYYIGWEAFFRGYMLFGLRDRYGDFGAILFQTFPSVLVHIGKPAGEIWSSVLAGVVLGAVALRTGSIFYVLLFHYGIGVMNDVFCALRSGLLGG